MKRFSKFIFSLGLFFIVFGPLSLCAMEQPEYYVVHSLNRSEMMTGRDGNLYYRYVLVHGVLPFFYDQRFGVYLLVLENRFGPKLVGVDRGVQYSTKGVEVGLQHTPQITFDVSTQYPESWADMSDGDTESFHSCSESSCRLGPTSPTTDFDLPESEYSPLPTSGDCSSGSRRLAQSVESEINLIGESFGPCKRLFHRGARGEVRLCDFSFSPNGSYLLTCPDVGCFKVWDELSGECLTDVPTRVPDPIGFIVEECGRDISVLVGAGRSNHQHVSYCYPARRKFLFGREGAIDVFDLDREGTEKKVRTLMNVAKHPKTVPRKVYFLADGKQVVVGYSCYSGGKSTITRIDVHNVYTGEIFTPYRGLRWEEKSVSFKQSFVLNGDVFFFMQNKNILFLWNVTRKRMVFKKTIRGSDIDVQINCARPQYFYISYNCGQRGFIERHDLYTDEIERINTEELIRFSVSPFGLIGFVCKRNRGEAFIGNIVTRRFLKLKHRGPVYKILFSPSGLSCAIAGHHCVYLWNLFRIPRYQEILPEGKWSVIQDNHERKSCVGSVRVNLIDDTIIAR
jgi:WD40 repeat protein